MMVQQKILKSPNQISSGLEIGLRNWKWSYV